MMPGDGGVQGAGGVEDAAAGGACDGLLVGEGAPGGGRPGRGSSQLTHPG